MCGIAGFFAPGADTDLLVARVQRALERLVHRGPDDQGLYVSGPVVLGHRRLIVIDRAGGVQPLSDAEGRVATVFNGEIYNHRPLRTELEGLGERFRSRSDTEVLVRAFAVWGPGAFGRLDGMMAAALWEPGRRTLTLVRDRAGEKPLYCADVLWEGGRRGVAFASEAVALLALLDRRPPLDPRGLWSYLTLGYARSPGLLQGIEEVPPGHYFTIRDGAVAERVRYWRPPPAPAATD